ncbi:hypothetical protein [Sphingomonas prati]|uniref:Uncharacterized protein n=1 Tax=Sphingomonas prati TaxID=1843237 RepID=A0A7W9BS46_9SPHN|nr:hypothetical protein [Sphingomonas prati]MBB5729148.1 hypothetical protein [Sphingomonas prati]GGE84733.1 hypothetical protein GCM10011404_16830 [Sphingomonas prati]
MREPSPRNSRLAITAGIVAVAVVGGGGFLLGQRATTPRPIAAVPAPVAIPAPAVQQNDAGRTLGRGDLIALAATAADATARGTAMPATLRDMIARPFSIALPFGCDGAATEGSDAAMRWTYDAAAGALRIHVAPSAWLPADWWPRGAPDGVEALEGFWVARPWTSSETCPADQDPVAATGAEPVTLPGQTLAVGQIFGPESGRQGRREGSPYTTVLRVKPEEVQADQGFRVRLIGHIAAAPDGAPVVCQQVGGAEQRPVCLVATSLDEVRIENGTTGATLATWPTDRPRAAS